MEFCQTVSEKNPMVAEPLLRRGLLARLGRPGRGALDDAGYRGGHASPVRLAGFGHANDFFRPKRDPLEFAERGRLAAGLATVSVGLDDLDLVEVHDCFTIAELVLYEVMGLAPRGEGRCASRRGDAATEIPVNLSGGLKAKGHPVGATGVSQHVLAAMQLSGTAGAMQLLREAGSSAQHGRLAVANYVSVLEAITPGGDAASLAPALPVPDASRRRPTRCHDAVARTIGLRHELGRVAVARPVLGELVLVVDEHPAVEALDDVEVEVDAGQLRPPSPGPS